MLVVGYRLVLILGTAVLCASPGTAQTSLEVPSDDMAAVEDYQPELESAEPAETAVAQADTEVWWGNRAVSYRNYIPIEAPDCAGDCTYCDKNMICCRTGCPCEHCQYICDDCSDCPPATFDKIFFDLDKAVLRPDAIVECNKVLEYLRINPAKHVLIEGHCCDLASEVYNIDLGRRRAEAVRQYLIENGVSAERILIETYGESRPWVGVEQRNLNRRAIVIVLPDGAK